MAITARDKHELEELFSELQPRHGGAKEDYFALLYLRRKFNVRPEEVAHQVAFGNTDYGVDAYYLDRPAKNLYLYQFKWSESHNLFKESMDRLISSGFPLIFGDSLGSRNQNDYLRFLKADLDEHREIIDRVYVHFVFKGDLDAAERSEGLAQRREDLENKIHLVHSFFGGRSVDLQVDFVSDRRLAPPSADKQVHKLPFSGDRVLSHENRALFIGLVPLLDLHRIHKSLGQKFFDRNIRSALSPENAPNRKLREAFIRMLLKEELSPEVFTFNHNGVTLAAERVVLEDGKLVLHVPRLLNGAQTLSTFREFLEKNDGHPNLREEGRLRSIRVLTKVVEDDPASDFVTQVTIANNQQNPVAPWTLRAMDRRQVDLADKFLEEARIFYSRQEGAFDNLSDEERQELGIEDPKDIRIRPFAQALLAVQGELDKMSRLTEVFENQTVYDSTFRECYLNSNVGNLILAYKVGLVLNTPMEAIRESAPQKYQTVVTRSRNAVWALLIQALFNDPKFSNDRDLYGGSLVKEAAFRDRLRKLANTRVWPILKHLFSMPAYQKKIEDGKYEFVRTKEFYRRAMAESADRFDWSKRSL